MHQNRLRSADGGVGHFDLVAHICKFLCNFRCIAALDFQRAVFRKTPWRIDCGLCGGPDGGDQPVEP